MKIYILTSQQLPKLCPDDKNLISAFKKSGIDPHIVIWNKELVPDNSLVLVRTIWDYAEHAHNFKQMLRDFSAREIKVINPCKTLLWNMDKTYLKELFDKGHSVVPTEIIKNFKLKDLNSVNTQYPLVIKPLVGASGIDTFKLDASFKTDLTVLNGRDVIVQPFIKSIVELGEISFIFFDNKFSHCLLKSAKKGEFRVQDDHGGTTHTYLRSREELAQVEQLLSNIQYPWSYARVDMVKSDDKLLLMELELIEPELFFRFSQNAEALLAKSILNCAPS